MENELKNFLKVNKLTQERLAAFLGVSGPFINKIATGKSSLPHHQWEKIRGKEEWDSSMLTEPTAQIEPGEQRPRADMQGRLVGLLEKKDEQIDRLLGIIEQLSK